MSISRRRFLTWTVDGAFLLAVAPPIYGEERPLSPWLTIAPDGMVTLATPVTDFGQAQILADALDISLSRLRLVKTPEIQPSLLRHDMLREAGAEARTRLMQAAARFWGTPASECETRLGAVHHRFQDWSVSYGALAAHAAVIAAPDSETLKQEPPDSPATLSPAGYIRPS